MSLNLSPARMLRMACVLTLAATTSDVAAQENLVPNPSFELISEDTEVKDIKKFGLVNEHVLEWSGVNDVSPDLFVVREKASKVSVPCNDYGFEQAKDGEYYAGFRAYSKSSKLKRSYLQVQLTEMLEENQVYCVSFDLSLAEMSRYAVPDIGAVLSDRKMSRSGSSPVTTDPDVQHVSNKTMRFSEGWETVCGSFVGTGEEEFLVIGCFGGDASIDAERVRVPARPTGPRGDALEEHKDCFNDKEGDPKTGLAQAYYYIDNVKVTAVDSPKDCNCGANEKRKSSMVYNRSARLPEDATAKQRIEAAATYYAFVKKMPTVAGKRTLTEMVGLLNENPEMNVLITGHADSDETEEGKLNSRYANMGQARADKVKAFLVEAGIGANRLETISRDDTDPASTLDTEIGHAKNRRVTFRVQ
ncbi:MAG: OmpA family protein [Bacteroidota bacterium]|nr:OmpA family protein [Bacteroidota bacterium]